MRRLVLTLSCLFAATAGAAVEGQRPVDLVNPLIDTATRPRWIFFASASRPFGMVSLSPDTKVDGDWGAGYVYGEPYIRTFSHMHDWQLAGVPVMPIVGRMNGHEGYEAYKAPFSHEKETARAGYHKVVLDNSGITVELTSTLRVGFHRYSFPATQDAYVLLDVGAPIGMTKIADASLRRVGPRQLAGFSKMAPTVRREKPCTVYFVVDFDRDFSEFGGWERAPRRQGRSCGCRPGRGCGLRRLRPLPVRPAGAGADEGGDLLRERGERASQPRDRAARAGTSTHVVRASQDEWNAWLSKIEVSGGTPQQRVKFYTDLWHALLGRRTFSDVDGRYVDNIGARAAHPPGAARRERPSDARDVQQRLVLGLPVEPERAVVVRLPADDERADLVARRLLHQRQA